MIKGISTFALIAAIGLSTAACTKNEKRYAAWGGGGAAAGALVGQALGHSTKATMIGAALGGTAGSVVAHEENKKYRGNNHHRSNSGKQCTYRNKQGRAYKAPC